MTDLYPSLSKIKKIYYNNIYKRFGNVNNSSHIINTVQDVYNMDMNLKYFPVKLIYGQQVFETFLNSKIFCYYSILVFPLPKNFLSLNMY